MSERKRGLGRGLEALIQGEEPLRSLPVDRLVPNRFQPRSDFDEKGIAELAESIRVQGMVQPIVVTPHGDGRYMVVAGERRWRAAQRLGLAEVPVVVRDVRDERQLLEMALVENLQRSDLNPVEEAEAYRSLGSRFGLSHEEIAARVGKARVTVTNALRLLNLPEEVREMLRAGRLTAGQARPLLALKGEERQLRLARRAVREGLSARRLEDLAQGGGKQARRARKASDPDTAAAEERLTRAWRTKVEVHRRGRGGSVRLHFYSEEELIRLFDLLIKVGGKRPD